MIQVITVIHLILAIALVGTVLLQRSEGGGLGMGGPGGGGGMGGFMTGRAAADLLTRTTAILAAGFFGTSLVLAIMAGHTGESKSILDSAPAPISAPAPSGEPSAPVGK